jgi:transcriptional regulator with XRE-family HTH domain
LEIITDSWFDFLLVRVIWNLLNLYYQLWKHTKGGDVMKLDTIGKNIRKFRLAKKLRQEDLAEKTDLTTNYIGMVERGEKIPSLETFIKIVNALGVSSDMVLTDVLETGYTVKNSMLNEKLEKLAPEDRNRIYEVIDTLVKQSKQILP